MQISLYTVKKHIEQRKLKRRSDRLKSRCQLYPNGLFLNAEKKQISRSKNSKQKTERNKYKWRLKKYIIK